MCFSLGQLDVADKVDVGYFFTLGDGLFGDKKSVLVPSTPLEGRPDVPPPCDRRKYLLTVEISQVTFSRPERRVCREDLALVLVLITVAAVATMVRGCLWRVCLVGY